MIADRGNVTWISAGPGAATNSWLQMKSHRWVRTSLRRVAASPITVSTWEGVTSFTTGQWSAVSAGAQWKRFLLQDSRGNARSGFEAARRLASVALR
jgi:hypothetical protein